LKGYPPNESRNLQIRYVPFGYAGVTLTLRGCRFVCPTGDASARTWILLDGSARCDNRILGVVGYRFQANILCGRFVLVDDLVAHKEFRKHTVEAQPRSVPREYACELCCRHVVLDRGLDISTRSALLFSPRTVRSLHGLLRDTLLPGCGTQHR
jgi:hypothetical protein